MKYLLIIWMTLSFAICAHAQTEKPPQFILISFDGSLSHNFWRETLALAENNNARFSYFVSGVFFIKGQDRHIYNPPHHKIGGSDIGFGKDDDADISGRTDFVWSALQRGFDIGSHANGHYDGGKWSKEDWASEFTQFHHFVENVFMLNPTVKTRYVSEWKPELQQALKGFRAPLLSLNASTQEVLKDFDYLYDASQVTRPAWPIKMNTGVWNIGLSQLPLVGTTRSTIAMDYNILYSHCQGVFNPKNGGECAEITPELLQKWEEQTYQTYFQAFQKSLLGTRTPISIGHHFSLWNKGIYWRALQRFVKDVCTQPEVQCVTHKELAEWMEKNPRIPSVSRAVPFFSESSESLSEVEAIVLQGDLPNAHAFQEDDNVDLTPYRVK